MITSLWSAMTTDGFGEPRTSCLTDATVEFDLASTATAAETRKSMATATTRYASRDPVMTSIADELRSEHDSDSAVLEVIMLRHIVDSHILKEAVNFAMLKVHVKKHLGDQFMINETTCMLQNAYTRVPEVNSTYSYHTAESLVSKNFESSPSNSNNLSGRGPSHETRSLRFYSFIRNSARFNFLT